MENNHGLHSARRLNRLAKALNAKSYVEIGVNRGFTFKSVAIEEKIAVDPKFLFEWKEDESEMVRHHEMTSDEFFYACPAEKIFDIFFLDGLHSFEQTYADFCNCIARAHARSVFLLDDTWPVDAYSALTVQSEALAARRAGGGKSGAWHGDVFKVVAMIHDYHLAFDYRTIFGSGDPQTLVWRSVNSGRTRRFPNPEQISRLGYFDLERNKDVFRPASEEDALAACIQTVGAIPTTA